MSGGAAPVAPWQLSRPAVLGALARPPGDDRARADPASRRVVVLGAGIAGLAAARNRLA